MSLHAPITATPVAISDSLLSEIDGGISTATSSGVYGLQSCYIKGSDGTVIGIIADGAIALCGGSETDAGIRWSGTGAKSFKGAGITNSVICGFDSTQFKNTFVLIDGTSYDSTERVCAAFNADDNWTLKFNDSKLRSQATAPAGGSIARTSTGSTTTSTPRRVVPPSGPLGTLVAYWSAINDHHFAVAYSYLVSGAIPQASSAFVSEEEKAGVSSASFRGHVTANDGTTATVAVDSLVTHDSQSGCKSWSGSYSLTRIAGHWRIAKAAITPNTCATSSGAGPVSPRTVAANTLSMLYSWLTSTPPESGVGEGANSPAYGGTCNIVMNGVEVSVAADFKPPCAHVSELFDDAYGAGTWATSVHSAPASWSWNCSRNTVNANGTPGGNNVSVSYEPSSAVGAALCYQLNTNADWTTAAG